MPPVLITRLSGVRYLLNLASRRSGNYSASSSNNSNSSSSNGSGLPVPPRKGKEIPKLPATKKGKPSHSSGNSNNRHKRAETTDVDLTEAFAAFVRCRQRNDPPLLGELASIVWAYFFLPLSEGGCWLAHPSTGLRLDGPTLGGDGPQWYGWHAALWSRRVPRRGRHGFQVRLTKLAPLSQLLIGLASESFTVAALRSQDTNETLDGLAGKSMLLCFPPYASLRCLQPQAPYASITAVPLEGRTVGFLCDMDRRELWFVVDNQPVFIAFSEAGGCWVNGGLRPIAVLNTPHDSIQVLPEGRLP